MEVPEMGFRYSDSAEISFDATEQLYRIGSNSRIWSTLLNDFIPQNFCAEEILLRATEDCYVRLQHPNGARKFIQGGVAFSFKSKVTRLYITRVTANGTLYIDAEGNIVL